MQQARKVILGFGLTLIGVAGALGIYLPRYSTMAQMGRDRTSRSRAPVEEKDDQHQEAESSKGVPPPLRNTEKKQE
uniref:Uncharacterized protein n=1 Tax=Peronospora matthiolae TaxID=2874970 RepID=A0AAV1UUN5_9STRA